MMLFVCLGYFDREAMDARPKEEIEAVMGQCGPHLEELYGTGRVFLDAGLGTVGKTIRRAEGRTVVTDGPFIESKEMIGSAFFVEAEDLDEAVRIASLHPAVRLAEGEAFGWGLEVRPIHYFERRDPQR